MNVLAELACARVPTSTLPDLNSPSREKSIKSPSRTRDSSSEDRQTSVKEATSKKTRNPIRELFERKKEINDRKHHEKIDNDVTLRGINIQRLKKSRKPKKQQQQDFPLIRKSQLGGMVERKKRRDDKKIFSSNIGQERIKDIYDFDDDESHQEANTVLSYRNKNEKNQEIATETITTTTDLDMADLMTKTIGDTLKNGKTSDALGGRLESMIDRKFQELESFPPKTKGALKSFHVEEKQRHCEIEKQVDVQKELEGKDGRKNETREMIGPMDEHVERKKSSRKLAEQLSSKHGRSKKRSKNGKKKSRNAWYENDSSDEFVTAAKAEDVGVGTTKSQRTCSKGKQNLFAELSTSSESDYDDLNDDYESKRRISRKKENSTNETHCEKLKANKIDPTVADICPENQDNESIVDWMHVNTRTDGNNELEHKKSESEMSDHPLIIDERKNETDEAKNSDDDTETRYLPTFELDDLYREDTTDETDEDKNDVENEKDSGSNEVASDEVITRNNAKECYDDEKELIPLEEALDLLDNNENLSVIPERVQALPRCEETLEKSEDSKSRMNENDAQTSAGKAINDDVDNYCDASNNEVFDEESDLPEKLSSNVKPQKESENLPLHVFLSRKVQESKKRKQQQAKKLQEEQERILMDFQPTRRQRKCAIGKQGLLAEISSSDEEPYTRETCRRPSLPSDKAESDKQSRKPKRESKEKRKERYMEKKHEQIIAKEQKAIEEEILRELEKTKGNSGKSDDSESGKSEKNFKGDFITTDKSETEESQAVRRVVKKKRQKKCRKSGTSGILRKSVERQHQEITKIEEPSKVSFEGQSKSDENIDSKEQDSPSKQKKQSKSGQKPKKSNKTTEMKSPSANRKSKICNGDKSNKQLKTTLTPSKDPKERRSSCGKHDSDDEELRTTRCWNKVDKGVGVAIGRRKRAAANQLYYWSSSSDEDEPAPPPTPVVEEEDDRREQHGWIVGDSHKRMITMLAMEKQLKEKRRRSEDEFESGKAKNKKHRNSTS